MRLLLRLDCFAAEVWGIGGSNACDEDSGLPAGELVTVRYLWERLGEHRSGEDDVDGDDVFSDGPLVASAGQNLFEEVSDFGLKRADLLVVDDGAAMEWEDEFVAGGDRLFEELDEGSRGRLVAQCGDPCERRARGGRSAASALSRRARRVG